MSEKRTYKLSSRGRRFCAALIDEAIPVVITIFMMIAFAIAGTGIGSYVYGYGYGYGAAVGGSIAILVSILALIAYVVVEIVFFAKSQSIGKAILKMQVVSSKNGKPIGIWWMLLREFIVKPTVGSAYLLGYIWILIDPMNRGWADKILDTYVVDVEEAAKPVEMEIEISDDAAQYEASMAASEEVVEPQSPENNAETETEIAE